MGLTSERKRTGSAEDDTVTGGGGWYEQPLISSALTTRIRDVSFMTEIIASPPMKSVTAF
jgi:hypothetical protein